MSVPADASGTKSIIKGASDKKSIKFKHKQTTDLSEDSDENAGSKKKKKKKVADEEEGMWKGA